MDDASFADIAASFATELDVEPPSSGTRRFGSSALKVDGSIFAMLTSGRLVLKLPAQRVDELISSGVGEPFRSGQGRPMRQWVSVAGDDCTAATDLAREALDFVRSGKGASR